MSDADGVVRVGDGCCVGLVSVDCVVSGCVFAVGASALASNVSGSESVSVSASATSASASSRASLTKESMA